MYDSIMTNRTYKSGVSREQVSLLPARVDDYVGPDNPVRAIEAFVGALDLCGLGFRHGGRGDGGVGQPPYDPADLLKLYLYGYLNQVRSSRRLEREAQRNLELIWLLRGLRPRQRTIADFRKENWAAFKAANRRFVLLLRELDLVGGELVAIDGAFFDGNASKASITTRTKLTEQLKALDRDIEAYGAALATNDAAEAAGSGGSDAGDGDIARKVAALVQRQAAARADLKALAATDQTQLSRTDADARLLSKSGQSVAGYNVQIAVDDTHKLIVASAVVNDGNDAGQLDRMAAAAKDALAVERLQVVADVGYYSGPALKGCEEQDVVAYVPVAVRDSRLAAQGRFTRDRFVYDRASDSYRCPAGEPLFRTRTPRSNADRVEIRYVSRKPVCDACPLRLRCVTARQPTREILRWEHEEVLERHRLRMQGADAPAMMRRRKALAEHPFGTLKCRAGYRHFLVRGFDRVRGEWSLMALCYNFTRLMSILGFDRVMEHLAALRRGFSRLLHSLGRLTAGLRLIAIGALHFQPRIAPKLELRQIAA